MIQPIIQRPSSHPGSTKRRSGSAGEGAGQASREYKKGQASENFIPSPESLATLVRSAIVALKSGQPWDRGSIINLNI